MPAAQRDTPPAKEVDLTTRTPAWAAHSSDRKRRIAYLIHFIYIFDTCLTSSENAAPELANLTRIETLPTDFPDVPADTVTEHAPWPKPLEQYVQSISDECLRYSRIHEETSKLYDRRHTRITASIIIVPLLVGASSLIPFNLVASRAVTGVLGLLGTLVGALNKMMRYNEHAGLHRVTGTKLMKLNGAIQEQMFLPDEQRYKGLEFERWARKTFFSIKEFAPYPNRSFERKMNKVIVSKVPPLTPVEVLPQDAVIVNMEGQVTEDAVGSVSGSGSDVAVPAGALSPETVWLMNRSKFRADTDLA
ncbi:hypothetical protein HKX48_007595 [Thoreauomyces humboldtii]|nr:hypothetical protein HKX48_007595 [Thoreauomyces humboldtii]